MRTAMTGLCFGFGLIMLVGGVLGLSCVCVTIGLVVFGVAYL